MFLTKIKNALLALVATAAVATAAGGVVLQDSPAPAGPGALPAAPAGVPPVAPPASKADVPVPPAALAPNTPLPSIDPAPLSPPTVEQLRARYVKLHEELAAHMSEAQVVQRVAALEQEVAAGKAQRAQLAREKKAADELEAARATLAKIANDYGGTEAAARAKQALDTSGRAPTLFDVGPPSPPKIDESPVRPSGGTAPPKK